MPGFVWFVVIAVGGGAAVFFLGRGRGGAASSDSPLSSLSGGVRKARTWLQTDKSERPSLREVFTDPEPEEVGIQQLLDEAEVVDSAYLDPASITKPLARVAARVKPGSAADIR